MSQSNTVDIPQELKASLRKFRFARRNAGHAAIVVKINKQKLVMEEVEQFDNITIEDLAEGAPPHVCAPRAAASDRLHRPQSCPRTRRATSCSRTS